MTSKLSKTSGNRGRDFLREIAVRVPADRLFDAIATVDGVRAWWTPLVTGTSRRGGTLRLGFEGMAEHIDLRVAASRRPALVEWTVLGHSSLDEWAGTTIRFAIAPAGDEACVLDFRHVGLSPKLECYDHCEAGWDHFLDSLVAFAERGQGAPFRGPRRAIASPVSDPAKAFEAVVAAFKKDRRVTPPAAARSSFGSNGLKVDGRIFAMLVRGALVVKLPGERTAELVACGRGEPFDAGKGRPMKEWVALPEPGNDWLEVAREARRFVGSASRAR